jgi:hypothetical protein
MTQSGGTVTRFVAKENIPAGGVLAYTRGQYVEADAVKANGWEDLVVGADTKEARRIHAEILGEPFEDDTATTSRTAAAKTEQKG